MHGFFAPASFVGCVVLAALPVGSRHIIRVYPEDVAQADVETGWNLEFLLLPVAALGFSFMLFAVSRRFPVSGMTP